ncbi:hypothetical protein PVAND_003579 [Polypedilum vanderplanki]|uniref:Valine--tRNA ligase n=1 Tax=Polypedilum vanderplanki TaxID=319348 RepID=A0A9J6BVH9_POLVA|nr:hypothetical protein PVAND_003579 [Polypedilum vanderplanki]
MTNVKTDEAANEEVVEKSAKQLEKEAKKAAKLAKLQEKQAKQATQQANTAPKEKEKKAKSVVKDIIYEGNSKDGEKKDLSGPMPEAYSPQYVEAAWYSWWEKQGFFKPEYSMKNGKISSKGQFVMVIPPPNVTGSLHLGHALTNSIEDAIARWHRMHGRTTLWVPGCDHAGIATQVVVEKKLWREEKLSRHDLGREKFIEKIWEWKENKGGRIYHQLRKIGSSMDWDRVSFTMDPKLCRAVTEAFNQMHEKGLIYRDKRLVNWSCTLKSAISDIEVDKVEIPGRTFLAIPGYQDKIEFGVLVSFAYQIEGTNEEIVVATTRIETMLGDTAVAIHPKDTRYTHLHGKFVKHPFVDRRLPIVLDDFVDMEFGTGAVKITPAHDPNDYEVGKRHDLPFITIFSDDGIIVGDYGKFTGMKRFDARKAVLASLKELGLYKETINNPMIVPICSRSKDVVEPLIKPQWYVKCEDMAKKATDSVKTGELKIIPESFTKTWFHWMDGIRDWCISRQLWWGHRIPAYFIKFKDSSKAQAITEEQDFWIVARSIDDAHTKAKKKFNITREDYELQQDEDVLDTWFSSGLFPFSVFGWPDQTEDLKLFYPTTLLETGHDILFFWVARMVFFGQTLLGKLPFKYVFLHPMVRDAHGRKMSKSLGNVIDPMDVINGISLDGLHQQLIDSNLDPREIEKAKAGQKQDFPNGIPECGTDAMRFTLCNYMTQARDINLDIMRVQGYRFFCNKLWNATKFALRYFEDGETYEIHDKMTSKESKVDLWILSKLSNTIEIVNKSFENYEFATATQVCYTFWLYELCDNYLECLKPVFASDDNEKKAIARRILYTCLDYGLRLLSPFMPFITEELFQRLPRKNIEIPSICVAPYPDIEQFNFKNEDIEKDFDFVQKVVKEIRSARSDYNIPAKTKTEAFAICSDSKLSEILNDFKEELQALSYCSNIELTTTGPNGCAILSINAHCEIHLLLKGIIEADKEIAKLEKKRETMQQTINKLKQKMSIEDYEKKVPENIQQENIENLKQTEIEIERIGNAIEALKLM